MLEPRLVGPYTLAAPFIRATEEFPFLVAFQDIRPVGIVIRSKRRKQLFDSILGTIFLIKDIDAVANCGILFLLFRDVVSDHHRLVFVQDFVLGNVADKTTVMPADMRRIKTASVFRDGITLLDLAYKRLCREVLHKSLTVFLIHELVGNLLDNGIVMREVFAKRIAHVNGLAFNNLDKGARDFALRQVHLEIAIRLIENCLPIKFFVERALQAFALCIKIHRLDFVAELLFSSLLDERKLRDILVPAFEPHPFLIIKITGPTTTDKTDTAIGSMPRVLDFRRLACTHLVDIRLDFVKMLRVNIIKPGVENIFGRNTLFKPKQLEHSRIRGHARSTAVVNFDSPKPYANPVQDICRQRYRVFISHKLLPISYLIKIIRFIIKISNQ